jgi:hypothetical protein
MKTTRVVISVLCLALVVAHSDRAAADELPAVHPALAFPAVEEQAATTTRYERPNWRTYGGPMLVMDAVTVASLSIPLATVPRGVEHPMLSVPAVVGFVGFVSYPLRGPLFHLGHGNKGDALASLGVRLGAPLSGLYGGLFASALYSDLVDDSFSLGRALHGAAWGTLGGMLAGGAVDSLVLARRPRPVLESDQKSGLAIAPTADIRDDGFQLGLRGRF